jgi:3-deoxy-D-manno-octulosonic-acid transferase
MSRFFYNVFLLLYLIAVQVASLFYEKAKKWKAGRKNIFSEMQQRLGKGEKRIWVHCSSLGEFEQGRPLMEALRKEFPHCKIVLTFFSPSGYEIRKNTPLADYVFYLPFDGSGNARRFIDLVNPSLVFFIKYEFWFYYINELFRRKIPLFSVSAIFRKRQVFFKWYGDFFRSMLQKFTHIFVQNQESLHLLYKNKVTFVTVSGDTRFDRVYQNSLHQEEIKNIREFASGKKIFVAGSTWNADHDIIIKLINESGFDLKYIIAPHEINEELLTDLEKKILKTKGRYSSMNDQQVREMDVLIIDSIGLLSHLYKYGFAAYIGGGFGTGIHNILEAAVYGIPVYFGPKHKRFNEATELIQKKGAFAINNYAELRAQIERLMSHAQSAEHIRTINRDYIGQKKGATEMVMKYLRMNFNL